MVNDFGMLTFLVVSITVLLQNEFVDDFCSIYYAKFERMHSWISNACHNRLSLFWNDC